MIVLMDKVFVAGIVLEVLLLVLDKKVITLAFTRFLNIHLSLFVTDWHLCILRWSGHKILQDCLHPKILLFVSSTLTRVCQEMVSLHNSMVYKSLLS